MDLNAMAYEKHKDVVDDSSTLLAEMHLGIANAYVYSRAGEQLCARDALGRVAELARATLHAIGSPLCPLSADAELPTELTAYMVAVLHKAVTGMFDSVEGRNSSVLAGSCDFLIGYYERLAAQ